MDDFLDVAGACLAYRSEGPEGAPALISTHEPTGSRAHEDEWGAFDWGAVPASGRRLVRYDLRGHGASTAAPDPGAFRWPALAADLLALADRISPHEPVDLLGVATGCGTVVWAAALAPHRIRRLVLVIPPPVGAARDRQAELYRAAADLAEVRGIEAWARAAAAMPPVPVLEEGGWRRVARPALDERLLPVVVRGDADSRLPADEVLARLEQPVLILAWAADASHPVETAERLAAVLPSARAEVALDAPAVAGWGRRVAAFLAEGSADAAERRPVLRGF